MILIDGERLAELMIDHNVGVSDRETYAVKRVDSDYFGDDECRTGRRKEPRAAQLGGSLGPSASSSSVIVPEQLVVDVEQADVALGLIVAQRGPGTTRAGTARSRAWGMVRPPRRAERETS